MAKFDPQFPIVIWGDGAQARAHKIYWNKLDDDGRLVHEFHLEPEWEMKEYYTIDDKYRSREGYIVARYLVNEVVVLNDDSTLYTIFIKCDFEYGDTVFTKGHPSDKKIANLVNEINIMRALSAKLEDEKIKAMDILIKQVDMDSKLVQTARKSGKDLYDLQQAPPGFEQQQGETQ